MFIMVFSSVNFFRMNDQSKNITQLFALNRRDMTTDVLENYNYF